MNTAIILAGGTGTRLGADIPKQYIEIDRKPIISYCLDVFLSHEMIDNIQIAADSAWHDYILSYIHSEKFRGFSSSGKNRQLSIYNAVCDVRKYSSDNNYVIIHDAARPFITHKLITDCLHAAYEHDGAIPVLPMKDTVYISENGKNISQLIERSRIFSGQAPEAFILGKYYNANKALIPDEILNINGSTEPAVMAGMDIAMISGDENNFKITTKADLERFKEILRNR